MIHERGGLCGPAKAAGAIFERPATQRPTGGPPPENARRAMQDVLMLLYTAIFFGLAFLYVKACQKLR
jgi:hypothetical protein